MKQLIDLVFDFLAALGLISACLVVGLWFGGFFHSVAKHNPEIWILQGLNHG